MPSSVLLEHAHLAFTHIIESDFLGKVSACGEAADQRKEFCQQTRLVLVPKAVLYSPIRSFIHLVFLLCYFCA